MAYEPTASNKLDKMILVDLNKTSSTAVHDVGYKTGGSDGKEYQFDYYQSSGVAAAAGGPMVWVNTTGDYVVTSDTSDGDAEGSFAGVGVIDQANADSIYCWLQTKGLVDSALVGTGVAAGDHVYVGQSDVFESVEDDYSSTTENVLRAVGIATTAPSGSGTSTASILLW